jgi:hypothetical protein
MKNQEAPQEFQINIIVGDDGEGNRNTHSMCWMKTFRSQIWLGEMHRNSVKQVDNKTLKKL